MTNPPAIESAVQTTPPITIEATMPLVPLSPMATKMAEAMMSVISVMPDTGLLPTMAMALAATVVKRNAMSVTTSHATRACQKVWITPNQKKSSTATRAMAMKKTTFFMLRSICQRTSCDLAAPPLNSRPARPTALQMMGHDFTMPITPAMAMPPMPIMRA